MRSVPEPSGPWCQRWRDGRHSWRHVREGGFDQGRYQVAALDELQAKAFCTQHHYAGASYPAALRRYGLTDLEDGRLVGTAVLGAPVSAAVLTTVLPTLDPYTQSQELARLVLLDEVPANAESWMLARVFRDLRDNGIRGVVSFADPVPRYTSAGLQVKPGHCGIIYQATGAAFTGRGTPRSLVLLPDGTVLNARAAQKVRSQEQGHQYVEARLEALGATTRHPEQPPASWLAQALHDVGARRLRHPGAYRYVFRLGSPREARRIPLGVAVADEYPKRPDDVTGRPW